MKKSAYAAAAFALSCSVAFAAPVTVDGVLSAGEYGTAVQVGYDPAAADSNFGAPSNVSKYVAYDIYSKSAGGFVYGLVQARPDLGGTSIGAFANIYFDLDRATRPGSDLGFELGATSQRAFIPGGSGPVAVSNVTVAVNASGSIVEFAIPLSDFTSPIAGLTYDPALTLPSAGDTITFRLSQSFGYSVAGGPTYGVDRLGAVVLTAGETTAAVPEPASMALLLTGLGAMVVRRRS